MIQITAILLVCVGLLVSVLFATGFGPFSNSDDQFADCRTSAVAGGSAAIGGPFELVDHKGRAVTEQDVIVEPSLIYLATRSALTCVHLIPFVMPKP